MVPIFKCDTEEIRQIKYEICFHNDDFFLKCVKCLSKPLSKKQLDNQAKLFGLERFPKESNKELRERIFDKYSEKNHERI